MTNWMTAAGIALIAGGLATLICFRAVLFRSGRRRARRAADRLQVVDAVAQPELVASVEAAGPRGWADQAGPSDWDAQPSRSRWVDQPPRSGWVDEAGPERADRERGAQTWANQRRSSVPAGAAVGDNPDDVLAPVEQSAAEELSRSRRERRGYRAHRRERDEEQPGGLASIGFADPDDSAEVEELGGFDGEPELAAAAEVGEDPGFADGIESGAEFEPVRVSMSDEADRVDAGRADVDHAEVDRAEADFDAAASEEAVVASGPARTDQAGPDQLGADRLGDRVDGWVRPEYSGFPDGPPSGEYWTPIPVDLVRDPEPSAKGYGWPMPVERLPAVPSYEPATGFDLEPVRSEPTEVMSAWPRQSEDRSERINLPRSWGARDENRPSWPPRGDSTESFPAVRDERPGTERRRPRPRPRPEPPADRKTTFYVSRHAAEPPR